MLNVKRINKNESYLAICENIKLYCMAEYGHDYDENEGFCCKVEFIV